MASNCEHEAMLVGPAGTGEDLATIAHGAKHEGTVLFTTMTGSAACALNFGLINDFGEYAQATPGMTFNGIKIIFSDSVQLKPNPVAHQTVKTKH